MSGAIRYGIIGAGYFGREFARILRELPTAELVGVFSTGDASALADEAGCQTFAASTALLDAVDAVIIASPNHAHRDYALEAARRDVAVFCEKPVALTYDECDAMVTACEAGNVLFLAGHVMRFMPGIRRTAQLLADGAIGEIVYGRAVRTGWEDGSSAPGWKKTRSLSGGHLFHHIHELDVIQHLMGSAETATMISGTTAQTGPRVGDEETVLLATLTFPGTRYATLEWGSVFRKAEHRITIEGTRGYVVIDMDEVGVEVVSDGRVTRFPLHDTPADDQERTAANRMIGSGGGVTYGDPQIRPPQWLRTAMRSEIDYFTDLLGGATVQPEFATLTDGTAARASIATAEALTLSASFGRTVDVDDVVSGGAAGLTSSAMQQIPGRDAGKENVRDILRSLRQ